MNQALLCKSLWRFGESGESLWRSVVVARHEAINNWIPSTSKGSYGCGPWRGILKHLYSDGVWLTRLGIGIRSSSGTMSGVETDLLRRNFWRFMAWRQTQMLMWPPI